MSKRITVYLPDDVATRVEQAPNASAYVTNALRGAMRQEEIAAALNRAGIEVTPEGLAAMRERYEAGRRKLAGRSESA